ncbi:MAG: uncharacterized protein HW380_1348 [Magnetococcales bacterium]|nr:uncharacterized protein [Magnetococcales bacterium]HIJ85939.1 DUF4258 domain-containing protein [Magnetococcales bacterium]
MVSYVNSPKVRFSRHAIQRMFERSIPSSVVAQVARNGAIIEDYPNDAPSPSRLQLGWNGGYPLHVVVAQDPDGSLTVITTYIPELDRWEGNYRRRKKK